MEKVVRAILFEASLFKSIIPLQKLLELCPNKCRKSVKTAKNSPHQVAVCTSGCRINILTKIISALTSLKGTSVSPDALNAKINYFTQMMMKEKVHLVHYRQILKKRQTTVPVSMSAKPSPERYDPRRDLRS